MHLLFLCCFYVPVKLVCFIILLKGIMFHSKLLEEFLKLWKLKITKTICLVVNFFKQIASLPCVRSTRRQPTKQTRSGNLEAIFMRNTELSKANHLLRTAQKHTPPTRGKILITDHQSIHETCQHRIDL